VTFRMQSFFVVFAHYK